MCEIGSVGFKLSPYLTPILLGWIAGYWLGYFRLLSLGLDVKPFERWVVTSSVVAPALAYGLNLAFFLVFEGVVTHGLMYFGSLLVFWWLTKVLLASFSDCSKAGSYVNAAVVTTACASCIGRLGCLFAGCCYGIQINFRLWFISLENFPSQLLESFFHFAILTYALFIGKTSFATKDAFNIYLTAYCVYRFFAEFLRGDHIGSVYGFSYAQCVILALALFYFLGKWYEKTGSFNTPSAGFSDK